MKELALIGSTASGKTSLSIALAKESNAYIFSIDSLAIYKHTDIVSARPSKKQRAELKHFGIDLYEINDNVNLMSFINIYKEAKNIAIKNNKNLIIIGGSSFYLKSLIDGISKIPNINETNKDKVVELLKDKEKALKFLNNIDKDYKFRDTYRLQKALEIYFQTLTPPSIYFKNNPKLPIIKDLKIFCLDIDKQSIIDNIALRTKDMIESGLIEEVAYLKKTYGLEAKAMKAIGIKETLSFLKEEINKEDLYLQISSNTRKLAKRQRTFNKNQFKNIEFLKKDLLYERAKNFFDTK